MGFNSILPASTKTYSDPKVMPAIPYFWSKMSFDVFPLAGVTGMLVAQRNADDPFRCTPAPKD